MGFLSCVRLYGDLYFLRIDIKKHVIIFLSAISPSITFGVSEKIETGEIREENGRNKVLDK